MLEMPTCASYQRQGLLDFLHAVAMNPQMLVDIYLNYDCDRSALDNNIFER